MTNVETEPKVFRWPPGDGTYRIRNLDAGGFWQLTTSKEAAEAKKNSGNDGIVVPSWVELEQFEKYCEAQQWILTFLHKGWDDHSGFYKITCVEGNTAIAQNLLPFGGDKFEHGPMSSSKEDEVHDVWYFKGLEVDGKKFTRIYPAYKDRNLDEYEIADGACEAHYATVEKETVLIVRITTPAKDDELCKPQDWIFQTTEDKVEKTTAEGQHAV